MRAAKVQSLCPQSFYELEVRKMRASLDKDYFKQKDEKIVRLDGDLQKVVVNAELWKHKAVDECVYFVDMTNETSVILYDPKFFSLKDFFVAAGEMPGEVPGVEAVRKAMKKSRDNKNHSQSQLAVP